MKPSSSFVCLLTHVRFEWTPLDADSPSPSLIAIDELSLAAGSSLFVGGASGSGKSTLLGLLSGVLRPRLGDVWVAGLNLAQASAAQRDRLRADHLGVIFQQFNLLPYLSVIENVLLPTRFSSLRLAQSRDRFGGPRAQAEHLLRSLGLDASLWARMAHQLSLGQQQRVAACRALMGSPQLVIADEPTSALDEDNRQSFLELLLRAQREQGAALVLVSHDRRMASSFEQVLDLGKV